MTFYKKTPLKYFLLLLAFFLSIAGYAQKENTIVVFKYQKDIDTYNFGIYKPLNREVFEGFPKLPMEVVSTVCKGDTCITVCKYYVKEPTCARVGDLLGHEIIILPNDSINVIYGSQERYKLAGKYIKLWTHDFAYEGKNKYVYSLFDSLANYAGDLRNGSTVRFGHTTTKLDSFCNEVKTRYQNRLLFLDNYAKRHNISLEIKLLAQTEINSAYLKNLITPLVSRKFRLNAYPVEYLNIIKETNINKENLFFKTFLYHELGYDLASIKDDEKVYTAKGNFVETFDRIKKKYSKNIAEQLLTLHLINYSNSVDFGKQIDSLFTEFKKISINNRDVLLVEEAIKSINIQPKVEYSLDQAFATHITDPNGKLSDIKGLFKSKPVILICWASWCKPCIEEIPYEIALEKEFGNKVDFIYMSFDKNKEDWKAKSSEFKLTKNNFLIQSNFKSDMASYYKITQIPRYFIYDRFGKIQNSNELRPSDKAFNSLMKQLIL